MRNRSFRVGLLTYQIVGGVGIAFGVGCSIGSFLAKEYWPISIFAFFTLMSLYIMFSAGTFELTEDAIVHQSSFGRFCMPWREVHRIEFGTQGSLVLHGENKRFALSPPAMWSGKQKPQAFELLKRKIEESGLVPYPSNVADYKIHKNVRVQRHEV